MKKIESIMATILGAALILNACTDDETKSSDRTNSYVTYDNADFYSAWKDDSYTTIQLSDAKVNTDGADAAKVVIDDQKITIKGAGTYVLEGSLSDGQVVIDTEEAGNVRLILNGATITSTSSAAILVKQADKTVISVEKGTENTITDGASRAENDDATGAIYAKDDLSINGEGTLTVQANAADGIVSKDQLKVTGGTINIASADDAVIGRDLFAMQNAKITIDAKGDGIKSTNVDDESVGNIVLESGKLSITARTDGVDAANELVVLDGNYVITTGGGSPETIAATEEFGGGMMPGANGQQGQTPPSMPNGEQPVEGQTPPSMPNGEQPTEGQGAANGVTDGKNATSDDQTTTEDTTPSTKGFKAEKAVVIEGGTFTIDSLDDAIHSNGDVYISDGTLTINTGDDGVHADNALTIADGEVTIEKSYEGLEGVNINIKGGHTEITATDDGVNVNGGNDGFSQAASSSSETGKLSIEGGYLLVDAAGDGLDSNGDITMTGGTAIVYGPTNNGNGALDYDGTFDLQGGTLIAAGSSGMAMGVSDSSNQNAFMMTFSSTLEANTTVTVANEDGKVVAAIAPTKAFQTIVVSSADLQKDGNYTLTYGGKYTGELENGFATTGSITDATGAVEFAFETVMTYLDANGVTEGSSGMGGGFGGGGMGGRPGANGQGGSGGHGGQGGPGANGQGGQPSGQPGQNGSTNSSGIENNDGK